MKKRILALLLSVITALSIGCVGAAAAPETAVTLYGFRSYDDEDASGSSRAFVSFSSDQPENLRVAARQTDQPNVYCGTYAGGIFYGVDEKGSLFSADMDGFSRTELGVAIAEPESWTAAEMTYDYATGRLIMMAINRQTDAATRALFSIDINTLAVTKLCDVGGGIKLRTLAADPEGILFGIDEKGGLYKVDASTGAPTLVGSTGTVAQFVQSMCFDRQTGILYWARYNGIGTGKLLMVDPATGETTEIAPFSGNAEITGLFVATDAFRVSFEVETGGSAGDNAVGFYKAGDRVTLTATPDQGYKFGGWSVSAGTLASTTEKETTLIMPTSDVVVKAFFIPNKAYTTRTIRDNDAGVSITGAKIYYNTTVSVSPWLAGEEGYSLVLDRLKKKDVILTAYHLDVQAQSRNEAVPFNGKVKVTVKVGEEYNGKKMTVYQLIDGKIVTVTAKVKDGSITYKTKTNASIALKEGGSGGAVWLVVVFAIQVILGGLGAMYYLRMQTLQKKKRQRMIQQRRRPEQ